MTTPTMNDRPICGACVAFRYLRPRMYPHPTGRPGWWACPVCSCVTIHPTDPDKTAEDLRVMFTEGAEITKLRQEQQQREYEATMRLGGPAKRKGGSSKSGRKRKKDIKPTRRYPFDVLYGGV